MKGVFLIPVLDTQVISYRDDLFFRQKNFDTFWSWPDRSESTRGLWNPFQHHESIFGRLIDQCLEIHPGR
jgi:hypothetical protein